MIVDLINTIKLLSPKFWTINPYVINEFISSPSEESKKQFAVLCDLIKILTSTTLIDINQNKVIFNGEIVEKFDIHLLIRLINSQETNDLFLCKYLASKIEPDVINSVLETLDLKLLKSIYELKK